MSIVENAIEAKRNAQRETRKKDQKALFYIPQCVDTKVFKKIVDLATTKATWETLDLQWRVSLLSIRVRRLSLYSTVEVTLYTFVASMVVTH